MFCFEEPRSQEKQVVLTCTFYSLVVVGVVESLLREVGLMVDRGLSMEKA